MGELEGVETPRDRLLRLHDETCKEAKAIMRKKQVGYATEADPYANFRMFGTLGILVRMGDKIARLKSYLENGYQLDDETVADTVKDMLNYGVLFLGMLKEEGKLK